MVKENFNAYFGLRIDSIDLENFKAKSKAIGKPHQIMIREIVKAFNEDRLKITPTKEQEESLEVYR